MKLYRLLIVLLTISCMTAPQVKSQYCSYIEHKVLYQIPHWKAKQNKSIYSEEQVDKYLSYFIDRWKYRGLPGDVGQIKEYFDKIELHWQQTKFTNLESKSKTPLLGLLINRPYLNKASIFVYDCSQEEDPSIGDTALGHELIHLANFAIFGTVQPDHFQGKGYNWSITFKDLEDEVNAKFK